MTVSTIETTCTRVGFHLLSQHGELLTDGRRRKRCQSGCDETFDVEPMVTRIHAVPADGGRP